MAGTGIDLSPYKPVAGQAVQAAPIANAMTLIESFTAGSLDPSALLQKAAILGQTLAWNGTIWAPATTAVAPASIGPTNAPSTTAAVASNSAYLLPVQVIAPTTISRIGFSVGVQSGNSDVGIYYSDDDATFTRLVSKGSTATPAAGPAFFTIGSTVLTPVIGRRWYLALACDNVTATFGQNSSTAIRTDSFRKASSFPLPSSITGATSAVAIALYLYGMI